ncbi:MAG: transcriptional repressor LexA [Rudaea sp.]|nr:transcriptional repressor LexA [Rudaea sp.]
MSISDRQRAILAFIKDRIELDGFPPTQVEIASAFGFKQNATANYHLRALEEAGEIARTPGAARSIRLLRRGRRVHADQLRLPVLGRVAAGVPIGADIGSDTQLVADRSMFSPTPDYLLRVQGDSMRDDGIFDGDLVAVRRTTEARDGQIVVARLEDEITIKRLKVTTRGLWLLPRNPDFAPIQVSRDTDFAIEGVFCGLVRSG